MIGGKKKAQMDNILIKSRVKMNEYLNEDDMHILNSSGTEINFLVLFLVCFGFSRPVFHPQFQDKVYA